MMNLLHTKKSIDGICKEIGADSLQYMSMNGLLKAITKDNSCDEDDCGLCLACLNGNYPCRLEKELLKPKKSIIQINS